MDPENPTDWLASAVEQFEHHGNRTDGAQVVRCLTSGLNLLRDSLYDRVHRDVEQAIGRDSMLMPVSEIKSKQLTVREIETYQTAEAVAAATGLGYADKPDDWFGRWLIQVRSLELGHDVDISQRCRAYLSKTPDKRRLVFMDQLGRIMPESRRAPLVLFRLVPLSIQITTALAFGDRKTAARLRREQATVLPAIADCLECRGRMLECVAECRSCGNPLWKHAWLVATD